MSLWFQCGHSELLSLYVVCVNHTCDSMYFWFLVGCWSFWSFHMAEERVMLVPLTGVFAVSVVQPSPVLLEEGP